jgi:hypothetical protein
LAGFPLISESGSHPINKELRLLFFVNIGNFLLDFSAVTGIVIFVGREENFSKRHAF